MTVYVKFAAGDINPERLQEEMDVASFGPSGLLYAGYEADPADSRKMKRFLVPRVIATSTVGGVTTEVIGEPGELHFKPDIDYTVAEEAALDTLLAAHDSALLSTEQTRDEKDMVALPIIGENIKRANWDALSAQDRSETTRRGLQLLFRGNSFNDLDTDDQGPIAVTIERAASTANFTLNNTGTAALITGLTLTPASGDYFLYATIEFTTSLATPSATDTFSVWVNNVEIAHSRRVYFGNTSIDDANITYVLSCKVSPAGSQAVEIRHTRSTASEPNIASNREMTLFPIPAAGTDYEDSSTTNDTTTSATMSTIVGMARTPVSGTYLVAFSSSTTGGTASTVGGFRVSIDGTPLAHTLREIFWESSGSDQELSVGIFAEVTVNGSQEVQIEFNRASGTGTITCHDRTMNLIPMATGDIFEATGTVNDTDSTTTDKLLDDMTITDPGADDYLCMFSMSVQWGTIAADEGKVTLSVHEGGAVVTDTDRRNEVENSLDNAYWVAYTGGRVTVGGATDDLEIFWQGSSTVLRTGRERTFVAIRELSTAWEQEGYRFRNDDGSESAATWRQLQDIVDTVDKLENIRLRVLLDATGDPPTVTRTLQYKRDDEADAEYRDV